MFRPESPADRIGRRRAGHCSRRLGYSIVELLVATLLTTIVMLAVVRIFSAVSEGVSDSRSMLETFDRVRAAKIRLQRDLAGITVRPIPPRHEGADGYLGIVEGPVGTTLSTKPWDVAVNSDDGDSPDTTVGDFDDILMFTTRSPDEPFVGRYGTGTRESDVAEVAWFLRGKNLYRRVLLVKPGLGGMASPTDDLSVRATGGGSVTANSLADLARRENRYAHPWNESSANGFPNDVRLWGAYRLPTAIEAEAFGNNAAAQNPTPGAYSTGLDFWTGDPHLGLGYLAGVSDPSSRAPTDLILTNVIAFDVQVYDPGVADYVDLGHGGGGGLFGHGGDPASGLAASNSYAPDGARVYDTWTLSYENDGLDQHDDDDRADWAGDGFDNDGSGVIDDASERETAPPYAAALRGVRVTIRVFEPDSRHVRAVTVTQDFSQ